MLSVFFWLFSLSSSSSFCTYYLLIYCILFRLPLTMAPISPVEVNYGSQAVEGLRRSFFFLFFCLNTGYTPSLATPPSIVCRDKIWTEVLLGKSFISQVQHAHVKMKDCAICIGCMSLVQCSQHRLLCINGMLAVAPVGRDQSQIAGFAL